MKNIIIILVLIHSSLSWAKLVSTDVLLSKSSSGLGLGNSTAGGESVGGGDNIDPRRHTAWFYGDAPIDVCIQKAVNFGLTDQQVLRAMESSISKWKDYFNKKQIGTHIPLDQKINTHFQIKNQCVGGEDLVIYLGTGPIFGNLKDLKARQSLSRPVAYVNKTHISEDYKWSKGYIRFVENDLYHEKGNKYFPQWNQEDVFYNLFHHEIGHIMGFSHKPQTIMAASISSINFTGDSPTQSAMTIDGDHELYQCLLCPQKFISQGHNTQGPLSIEVDHQSVFFITSNQSHRFSIVDKIDHKPELILLSMFQSQSYRQSPPHLYFLSDGKQNYTLEIKDQQATLRHQGLTLGTFQKESL